MAVFKPHHVKQDVVFNRPNYRESRFERATKVYTINQESKYLLVQNVHALGATKDLLELFSLYGDVEEYRFLDEYPSEKYCEVYWIKFSRIGSARIAKRKLDNWSFYGKALHVCYAPEYETVLETRDKIAHRRNVITQKTLGESISRKGKCPVDIQNHSTTTVESAPLLKQPCPNQSVLTYQIQEGHRTISISSSPTSSPVMCTSDINWREAGYSILRGNVGQSLPLKTPPTHPKKRKRI